ncbi:MAG TPA: ankyrin repeat domain-containing protein [Candidatus Binatia bacterium]|jgi:hypothetical protein
MVGFSLMHGGYGIILFLVLWGGLIWLLATLIFAALSKGIGGKFGATVVVTYAVAWLLISTPYGFWQRLFIGKLAKGPHAVEFIQDAAAVGDLATVRAFLETGIGVDAIDRGGATALHAAAVGGQVRVAEYLFAQGANVNAVNLYGDSPLENAESMNRREVAQFLASHGAKRIRGTDEQRKKVADEIFREQMEQFNKESEESFNKNVAGQRRE